MKPHDDDQFCRCRETRTDSAGTIYQCAIKGCQVTGRCYSRHVETLTPMMVRRFEKVLEGDAK